MGKLPPLLHRQRFSPGPFGEILEHKLYLTGRRPKVP